MHHVRSTFGPLRPSLSRIAPYEIVSLLSVGAGNGIDCVAALILFGDICWVLGLQGNRSTWALLP